jgi:hypothetical protein
VAFSDSQNIFVRFHRVDPSKPGENPFGGRSRPFHL